VCVTTTRDVTEEVIDVLGDVEMLVRVEAKLPLEVSHFVNSKCSSVDVGGSGLGSSVANSSANVEEGGLVAQFSGKKSVCDFWYVLVRRQAKRALRLTSNVRISVVHVYYVKASSPHLGVDILSVGDIRSSITRN
jgi:hypothetical protein